MVRKLIHVELTCMKPRACTQSKWPSRQKMSKRREVRLTKRMHKTRLQE